MTFFKKTEVWVPVWKGWVLIVLFLATVLFCTVRGLYPWMAVSKPRPDVTLLIVEGWLSDDAVSRVVEASRPEQQFVTTGGPVRFAKSLLQYDNYADLAAERLIKLGVDRKRIVRAPAPLTDKDRTYISAVAVRRALDERGLFGKPCNVYSMGAHARRSHYLYKKVFGCNYPLGIVSLQTDEVDLSSWWTSSEAFKSVLNELFSLTYTYCTFYRYEEGGQKAANE